MSEEEDDSYSTPSPGVPINANARPSLQPRPGGSPPSTSTAIASPGALFAFNRSGFANPSILVNSLRLACKNDPPSDLFVLQLGTSPKRLPSNLVTKGLTACGIRFPGHFRVVAKRSSPEEAHVMTIWRLRSRGEWCGGRVQARAGQ